MIGRWNAVTLVDDLSVAQSGALVPLRAGRHHADAFSGRLTEVATIRQGRRFAPASRGRHCLDRHATYAVAAYLGVGDPPGPESAA